MEQGCGFDSRAWLVSLWSFVDVGGDGRTFRRLNYKCLLCVFVWMLEDSVEETKQVLVVLKTFLISSKLLPQLWKVLSHKEWAGPTLMIATISKMLILRCRMIHVAVSAA